MLIEMWSPVFKESARPIQFHKGLNVILGMNHADNSIGKSSTLLAVDFVFGGSYYLKSVAVRKIGDHTIFSCFEFDKKYYFSRSTDKADWVTLCDEDYTPTETIYKLEEFTALLQEKYELKNTDLSFRLAISGFFRVAGKTNNDPDFPLRVHTGQNSSSSIMNLIQLFNKYDYVKTYKDRQNEKLDQLKTFKNARKYNFISNLVGGKTQFEINLEKIKELETELLQLQGTNQAQYNNDEIEKNQLKVTYRNQKLELEKLLREKQRRLKLVDLGLEYGLYPTEADLTSLQQFFPDINIKKIYEVEKYHKKLARILDTEFNSEKETLMKEISELETQVNDLSFKFKELGTGSIISIEFLERYAQITANINVLREQNKAFLSERELQQEKKNADSDLKRSIELILAEIQDVLNTKMREFNNILYPDNRKSPMIQLKEHNSYSFLTPDDDGTGTKYKGMLIYDLAMLYLTNLPALAHDSLLFVNISHQAVAGLMALYDQSKELNKQVFIAFDRAANYLPETTQLILDNTVLRLSNNGDELYGRSWSKGSINYET